MNLGELAWVGFLCLAVVYWLRVLYGVVRLTSLARLGDELVLEAGPWPRLSVVVPARDQAATIEATTRALLAQGYPELQLVLVDDRSSDATGAVVDSLAAEDPRVVAIHLTDLPSGWLGKVHAMQRGLERADGELVLFTDADVSFSGHAVSRAVALAEREHLDHLAAIPQFWPAGLLVDALVTAVLRSIMALILPSWRVTDPHSRQFFGVGAFSLVRRATLARTEGLPWLRMETADDMALGLLLKRSGARCRVVTAFDEIGLHWYSSVAELARGMEKTWAAVFHCNLVRGLALSGAALAAEMSPLAGLVALGLGPGLVAHWLGGTLVLIAAGALLGYAVWSRGHILAALAGPLLAPVLSLVSLRSMLLGLKRGGIAWRGTVYPCRELRRGMRVRIPF